MSKAHICDRCGTVYSTKETGVTVGLADKNVPITVKTWPTDDKDWSAKRELCAGCSEALSMFFEGGTVTSDD